MLMINFPLLNNRLWQGLINLSQISQLNGFVITVILDAKRLRATMDRRENR